MNVKIYVNTEQSICKLSLKGASCYSRNRAKNNYIDFLTVKTVFYTCIASLGTILERNVATTQHRLQFCL